MMPATENTLHCIVVTPEQTVLDRACDFVAVPLTDGETGFLPGRAPLIARLGYGELRAQGQGNVERFFVDGGFVQVQNNVIAVLTPRAVPAAQIDAQAVSRELKATVAQVAASPESLAAKQRTQLQLRGQLAVAARAARS